MVISPAMSLLKTAESPLALLSWPISFSPSVNIKTSGCGLVAPPGAWAQTMALPQAATSVACAMNRRNFPITLDLLSLLVPAPEARRVGLAAAQERAVQPAVRPRGGFL